MQGYPDLVTVLVGAHYVHHLLVRPLLTWLPNAHLELSRYEPIGEIEALRTEFGARRLVYGSWYPQYAMGPMLFYLHHTDLSEEELASVCAGNLARILGVHPDNQLGPVFAEHPSGADRARRGSVRRPATASGE